MRQCQAPTRHRLSVAMAPCPPSTWTMMTVSSESWTQPYSTSCPRNTLTRDFAPHPPHQTPCKLLIVAWNVILTTVSKQHGLLVQKMSCDTFLRTVYKFLFKTLQTECIVFLSSDQEITGFPNCSWNQFFHFCLCFLANAPYIMCVHLWTELGVFLITLCFVYIFAVITKDCTGWSTGRPSFMVNVMSSMDVSESQARHTTIKDTLPPYLGPEDGFTVSMFALHPDLDVR